MTADFPDDDVGDGTFLDQWTHLGPLSSIYIDSDDVLYVTDTQTAALPAWYSGGGRRPTGPAAKTLRQPQRDQRPRKPRARDGRNDVLPTLVHEGHRRGVCRTG